MAFDPHANFAISTVATAPSPAASGLSLTVSAGTGALFPAAPFNATVWPTGVAPLASNAEIVRVTAVVGDVLTIVRAQEGTTARTIVIGDQIANTITVKVITDLETAIPSTAGLISAINVSAGVTSNNLSALTFSNSNGVSFGLTGSVLTATVATNYQSQGAYLTTAALSQDSSKYAGTNGAITGGSITVNTSGVSVNLPAYLTTGMASNRGTDFVQATAVFAGTNASGTIASGAISVSVGAPGAASFNISAGTTSNNTTALRFADSNGVSFGLNAGTITATVKTDYQTSGAYLTTAMQSNAATISNVRVSGGTTSNLLSAITFADGNGVSFGLNASTLTATVRTDYQSSGAYLTTAMASNRGSDFVQATAAFAGTNASGTIASDGISVSVAPPSAANFNVSAGTTSNDTTALAFADSNGVSFGLNAGTLTATVKTDYQTSGAYLTTAMQSNAVTLSNVRVSAGTTSNLLSALTFSNSNGLAFGLDAGTITGSYTVPTVPAQTNQTVGLYASSNTTLTSSGTFDARSFSVRAIGSLTAGYSGGELLLSAPLALTTAMASNRGSDFVQATAAFAGTNANGTINSTGISVSVAAQTNQSAIKGFGVSNTGQTAGNTGISTGIDWVLAGSNSITLSQSTAVGGPNTVWIQHPAWITTARASTDAIGLNTAKTNVTWTVNSSGLSFDAGGYAGTGFTSTTTAGTAIVGTNNTAGLSVGVPNYLTTAMASNRGSDFVAATAAFAGTNASGTIASDGISVSVAAPGAAAENNWITLTGNVSGNSSASGSTIAWSGGNGVTLSGTNNSVIGISVATFDTVGTATTVYSVASANSVGTITRWAAEDHRHAGIGGLGISTSGNTAGTTGSNVGSYWLEGGNNITVSQITSNNGSHTIVIAGGGAAALSPLSYYLNIDNYAGMATGASAITQTSGSSIFVQPFTVGNDISASYLRLLASFNDSAVGTAGTPVVNSTFSVERYTTIGVVLYSQGTGANSRSIQYVTSTSAGLTGQTNCGAGAQSSRYTITLAKTYPATGVSNNNWTTSYAVSSASIVVSSNSNTLFTGPRYLDIPFAQSIAPGNYWMGIGASTSSASQSGNISAIGTAGMAVSLNAISQIAMSFGPLGVATSASDHQMQLGVGVWTTNASNWSTSSIALSQISQLASNPQLPFQMIRQV